ncbi:MAG: transposase, partial [Nitrospirae bacterium]|nr:transposase [Nitrospirota bacterium]
MIQRQLKLKLTKKQETTLTGWLNNLTGVWNFAIRKIELDAKDGIYYTPKGFQNLLADHGKKLEIPSHTIQGVLANAHLAWKRCFKKLGKKPRLKGLRNKLNSIPFPDPIKPQKDNRIGLPGLGKIRFHKQELPSATIKCGRIVRKASGWYLCLFIDAEPNPLKIVAEGQVGIDPGFKHLLTLSTGKKIEHPKELQQSAKRLAQAQRGHDKKLAARLNERIANQRKDRNHRLSRELVAENAVIVFSKDNIKGLARSFGKSVAAAATGQLREFLSYKSRTGGRRYLEVPSKNSTRICSTCGALTGPTGRTGLSVRLWT